jgi:hypothetical protein
MRTAPPTARQRLLELVHLTPQPHHREGYVMALRNAVNEYVQAILEKGNAAAEYAADLDQRRSTGGRK